MSWLKAFLYGTGGFLLGGPIGGGIGMAFGLASDDEESSLSAEETLQLQFFISVFCLSAKMAKADGIIQKEEISIIDHFIKDVLELNSDAREMAIKIFREAKDSSRSFEEFASDFYSAFRYDHEKLVGMLHLLLAIALADNVFHPNEEKMILSAVNIFNLSQNEYEQIKASYIENTDKYYAILECTRNDSIEKIKMNYRRLVNEYHPDKITSLQLPKEFIQFATNKFQEIQQAYDIIKNERKMS